MSIPNAVPDVEHAAGLRSGVRPISMFLRKYFRTSF
jgi:hypothetical protein